MFSCWVRLIDDVSELDVTLVVDVGERGSERSDRVMLLVGGAAVWEIIKSAFTTNVRFCSM